MRRNTRIGLFIFIIMLGLLALILASTIWRSTPFFDMRLVLLEAIILLGTAILFAIAVMAPPDRKR